MNIIKIVLILIPLLVTIFVIRMYIKHIKKESNNIIIPALLIYIIITIIIYLLICNIPIIKDILNKSDHLFVDKYIIILLSCSISTVINCPIAILIDKLNESISIKKLENNYNQEEIKYFRDLIKDIPPAMLSIIYNPKSNIEDLITSSIIHLEHNNIIEIKDDSKIQVNRYSNLYKHQEYLIEVLQDKNRYDIKKINKTFKKKVIEDLHDNDLLINKINNNFTFISFMEGIDLILIISQLLLITSIVGLSSLGIITFFSYFISFISIPIYSYVEANINNNIRSKKGIEIKAKLNGLSNYLKDFTDINNKSIEEIKLYDDYILYAIIFDLKGKLDLINKKIYNVYKSNKDTRLHFYIPKDNRIQFILVISFLIILGIYLFKVIYDTGVYILIPVIEIFPVIFIIVIISFYIRKE